MDHPNIAKVFDAGATDKGRPYFVMELVRGVRITEFCDEANLPTAERLKLFITVCQAVQHAHQKGIIHRDLKPSNILVTPGDDGQPLAKVIDFGVAKAIQQSLTEETVYTQFEQMIGTPAYMSPEQAGLGPMDIDTRSDVYSLGVLLYELLTGRPPFDPKELRRVGLDEMRRVIREVEPPRPSSQLSTLEKGRLASVAQSRGTAVPKLLTVLRSDLDWIVVKAIDKDRARRYETANGLAADIRRFLHHEPVSAGPPGFAYRARKFISKHRGQAAAAVAVFVTLLGGLSVSTILYLRERKALAGESEQKRRANQKAEDEQLARREAEDMSRFLAELLQSPSPGRDGYKITVAELLNRAAKHLPTQLASQPKRRVALQIALGRTYSALGLDREAIPLFEQIRDCFLAAAGPEHPETLEAMHYLAMGYSGAGREEEALKLQENVLAVRRRTLGHKDPSTLHAMNNLALTCDQTGREDEALKLKEELLVLRREVDGPEHPDTLKALNNLAISYAQTGRRDEAIRMQEDVLTRRRKLLGPEHSDTLMLVVSLASHYAEADRREHAREMLEEVWPLFNKVLARRGLRPEEM